VTINTYIARGMTTLGIYRAIPFKVTGPSSYTTGGHAVAEAQLGLVPELMPDVELTDGTTTRVAVYNYTTGKYQAFVPNTNVEVANGVDLSTFTGRGLAVGK
jgi:hypothetical protein